MLEQNVANLGPNICVHQMNEMYLKSGVFEIIQICSCLLDTKRCSMVCIIKVCIMEAFKNTFTVVFQNLYKTSQVVNLA